MTETVLFAGRAIDPEMTMREAMDAKIIPRQSYPRNLIDWPSAYYCQIRIYWYEHSELVFCLRSENMIKWSDVGKAVRRKVKANPELKIRSFTA